MEERLRQLWADTRELNLGVSGEVDRLPSAPTALRFLRDYVSPNKPCIISASATAHWPAISRSLWASDPYLLRALGDQPVSVHLTPTGRADSLAPHPDSPFSLCFASAHVQPMPFPAALRLISDASSTLVAYAQQQNDCLRSEYSPLSGDVDPHIPWATEAFGGAHPDAVNLWIGNARSHTSFHKDHYENLYAVITGEKHFLLLPPTEAHRLYIRRYTAAGYKMDGDESMRLEVETPEREVPWCSVDPYPETEAAAERQRREFPMYFEGPGPFRCTVRAGEILYLPSMWFHHVRQSPDKNGRTIAVNYWYDMQFDIKYAYFNFLQSIDCLAITDKDVAVADSRDNTGDSEPE